MRNPKPRLAPLALSLILVATAAANGCAKERVQMDPNLAAQAFPDDRMAELARAVARGDAAQIRRLSAGVDLDAQGDKGVTLLEWAIWSQSPEGMRALLDAGADPHARGMDDATVVHMAARVNDPTYLAILLAHGARVDVESQGTGETPLAAAVMSGREEQFKALLKAGANPNHADRMGNTPLHVAGKLHRAGYALELLKHGADPALRNAQRATFQDYLHATPEHILSSDAKTERAALHDWMRANGVPIGQQAR